MFIYKMIPETIFYSKLLQSKKLITLRENDFVD